MELIKENEKGKIYQVDNCKIFYRYKGSISGDNSENNQELIYLISGSVEITLGENTWTVEAPAKIEFPARTHHVIKALTDISFVLWEM